MNSGDVERMRSAMDVLNSASHQVAQNLYGQTAYAQQGAPDEGAPYEGGPGQARPTGQGQDYVDAEWRQT